MYPQCYNLQIWNELRLVKSLIGNYTTCFPKKFNSRKWNNNIPMVLNVQKWELFLLLQYFFQILHLISFQLYGILDNAMLHTKTTDLVRIFRLNHFMCIWSMLYGFEKNKYQS